MIYLYEDDRFHAVTLDKFNLETDDINYLKRKLIYFLLNVPRFQAITDTLTSYEKLDDSLTDFLNWYIDEKKCLIKCTGITLSEQILKRLHELEKTKRKKGRKGG